MATTTVVNVSKKCNPRENQEDFRRSTNGCVYLGRKTRWTILDEDSFWHNRFKEDEPGKKRDGTLEECIEGFRLDIVERRDPKRPDMLERLPELVGKRLACYCVSEPIDHVREKKECHGEILLQLLAERGLI